jgi:hypothetical protein
MIAPFADGAVHDTAAVVWERPAISVMTGAPGGRRIGTTDSDFADDGPEPTAFLAVTVNVYDVPLINPVIVHGFTSTHEVGSRATDPA